MLQRGAMLQAMFLHRHDVGAKQQTRLSAMLYGGAVRLCFPHDPVLVLRLLKKELPSDGVEEVCSFLPEEHTSMGSKKQTHTDPKAHPPAKKKQIQDESVGFSGKQQNHFSSRCVLRGIYGRHRLVGTRASLDGWPHHHQHSGIVHYKTMVVVGQRASSTAGVLGSAVFPSSR